MTRRTFLAALALPALLVLFPSPSAASAREDLHAAWTKFLAIKSFRASITQAEATQPATRLEFQAPDRYRISIANGPVTVVVGDTATMTIAGRSTTLQIPVSTLTAQYRDPAVLEKLKQGLVIEDLGADTLDGEPVRKLRYVQDVPPPTLPGTPPAAGATPAQATTVAWLSPRSGLVVRLQVETAYQGKTRHTDVRYSDFDDPSIVIEAPPAG